MISISQTLVRGKINADTRGETRSLREIKAELHRNAPRSNGNTPGSNRNDAYPNPYALAIKHKQLYNRQNSTNEQ